MNYELYNHTTVRLFKDDELMRNEFYDELHCENSTSLITLMCDKLK